MPNYSVGEWIAVTGLVICAGISVVTTMSLLWHKIRADRALTERLAEASRRTSWSQAGLWVLSSVLWVVAVQQMIVSEGEPFPAWAGAFVLDVLAGWLHRRDKVLATPAGEFDSDFIEFPLMLALGVLVWWLRGFG